MYEEKCLELISCPGGEKGNSIGVSNSPVDKTQFNWRPVSIVKLRWANFTFERWSWLSGCWPLWNSIKMMINGIIIPTCTNNPLITPHHTCFIKNQFPSHSSHCFHSLLGSICGSHCLDEINNGWWENDLRQPVCGCIKRVDLVRIFVMFWAVRKDEGCVSGS